MKIFALFIFIFSTHLSLFACKCNGVESFSEKDLNEASAIFRGKVINIEEDATLNLLAVTFALSENYLNPFDLEDKIIYTFSKPAFCGLSVVLNSEWYIHSTKSNGLDLSSRCGRSAILTIPELDRENPPVIYEYVKDAFSWHQFVEMELELYARGLKRFNEDVEIIRNMSVVKLIDFKPSECDNNFDPYRLKTRIIESKFYNDTFIVEVGTVAICCMDFIPAIHYYKDTLALNFTETGAGCECKCCYQFKYYISGLKDEKFTITLQGEVIEHSNEKYNTYSVKYFTFKGDTTGFTDKYGQRQGVLKMKYKENFLIEQHFKDNTLLKYVLTDKNGNVIKEDSDYLELIKNDSIQD